MLRTGRHTASRTVSRRLNRSPTLHPSRRGPARMSPERRVRGIHVSYGVYWRHWWEGARENPLRCWRQSCAVRRMDSARCRCFGLLPYGCGPDYRLLLRAFDMGFLRESGQTIPLSNGRRKNLPARQKLRVKLADEVSKRRVAGRFSASARHITA